MLIAVVAALGSAALFAVASVVQHGAAKLAPAAETLRFALLIDLLHRPRWLWGLVASAAGFGLQGVALHFGRLTLVQPLILVELLFALPVAAHIRRRTVPRSQWISALAIAAGLGLFLSTASPHGGRPSVPILTWLVVAFAVTVGVGLCAAAAQFASSLVRTMLYANAAGVMFGLLAALLDNVAYLLAHRGVAGTLTSWQPYALALVAPVGEVFAQSAFQAGPLSASLPFMYTTEPGSAIVIGVLAFGERVAHTPLAVAVEAVSVSGLVAGVVVLSRAPLVQVSERARARVGNHQH
ncbi:MAG TPA: DMT family transporter [Mycobacterium sp.]|nr:DMT family transporter [Mycobacterium sp.]